MITKNIILKSLDDAISKCGQKLTLSNRVTDTFNRFDKEVTGSKKEKAIFVDDDGEILVTKKGGEDKVNVFEAMKEAYKMNDDNPIHLNHNHPNKYGTYTPTALSNPDILVLLATMPKTKEFMIKSITAVDSFNNSKMTLVRGDNFNPEQDMSNFNKAVNYLNKNMIDDVLSYHFMDTHHKFRELWDKIQDKPKIGSDEYHKLIDKVMKKASKWVLVEHGFDNKLRECEKLFREANCKLDWDWSKN